MRILLLIATLLLLAVPGQAIDWPRAQGGGTGVPGLSGSTMNDATLAYLPTLPTLTKSGDSIRTTVFVDPARDDYDGTGDGSYQNPYFSFIEAKRQCLFKPHTDCIVKGRDRVFTHTLLTLAYGSASTRHLQVGETVTFTNPTGTAEVLAVYGDLAAVTWASGVEPRTCVDLFDTGGPPQTTGSPDGNCDLTGTAADTTFSAGGGESVGDVTKVTDSISGYRTIVFDETQIDTTTDRISYPQHDYADGDGPFLWWDEGGMPTFTGSSISRDSTEFYVCNVSGSTFQLGTAAGCGTIFDFATDGTGDHQIAAGIESPGLMRTLLELGECLNPGEVCIRFRPEFTDSPWTFDGNRLHPGGLYAHTAYNRWGSLDATRVAGGAGTNYNPAVGGLFYSQTSAADPTAAGIVSVENGTIQNVSIDCLSVTEGGMLLALNVNCRGIRNGAGDRSQDGVAFPAEQAHNSVVSATGTNGVDPTAIASALWWINGDGESEYGSDQSSGGIINPNAHGAITILTRNDIKQDGILGDTCVGGSGAKGSPCNSYSIVAPGGDLVMVGPNFELSGNTNENSWIQFSGGNDQRVQFANVSVRAHGTLASASNNEALFYYLGSAQGVNRELLGWNSSFTTDSGSGMLMIDGCPLLGTSAATATGTLTLRVLGSVWDGFQDYLVRVSDCGASGYVTADAVARATVDFEGIFDLDESTTCGPGGVEPCFVFNPSSRILGTCADCSPASGANCFAADVCNSTDSAGNATPVDGWELWVNNSADSGGAADGLQWATDDPRLRCADSTKECHPSNAAALTPVTANIDLRDYWNSSSVSCLPAEVLGQQVCSIVSTGIVQGAR